MHQKILYQHWQQQQQLLQEKQAEQEEEWEESMSVERTPSPYHSDMSTNSGSDSEHSDNYNFHVLSAPDNDSQNDKKRFAKYYFGSFRFCLQIDFPDIHSKARRRATRSN